MDTSINRTAYCGPSGVLIVEVSLYRTAYCGPSGVLIVDVSLYRTAYCGPSGVLIMEVSLDYEPMKRRWLDGRGILREYLTLRMLLAETVQVTSLTTLKVKHQRLQ